MRIYAPSRMQSVKDMPAMTKMKFRCGGGATERGQGAAWRGVLLPLLVLEGAASCRPDRLRWWLSSPVPRAGSWSPPPSHPCTRCCVAADACLPTARSRHSALLGPARCVPLPLPVCPRRQPGQNTEEDLRRSGGVDLLRSKLEEKERKHFLKTKSTNFEGRRGVALQRAAPLQAEGA